MNPRSLLPLAASAALLLSTGRASAEDNDFPRRRFGIAFGGGLITVPRFVTVGLVSGQAQAGVRFNKTLGLRSGADLEAAVGKPFETIFAVPLLFELMLADTIEVAAGPELGFSDTRVYFRLLESERFVFFYGGKLSLAWHIVDLIPPIDPDRKNAMLMVGLNVSVRSNAGGLGAVWDPEAPPLSTAPAILPTMFVGIAMP